MSRRNGGRERRQQRQDFPSMRKVPARQLADHEWMAPDLVTGQAIRECWVTPSKMVDPDRSVDEHQVRRPGLRLRVGRRPGSLPPSAERRRALSLAINASRAARTVAVFSFNPDSFWASRKSDSSIFRVVLICINMPDEGILVKLLQQIFHRRVVQLTVGPTLESFCVPPAFPAGCAPTSFRQYFRSREPDRSTGIYTI